MDEFVHRPKPFKGPTPKIDQIMPPPPKPKIDDTLPIPGDNKEPVDKITPGPNQTKDIDATSALTASGIDKPSDDLPEKLDIDVDNDAPVQAPEPKKRFNFKFKKPSLSKKQWLIILGGLLVLIIGAGAGYWFFIRDINKQSGVTDEPIVVATPTPTPTPTSPLTGLDLSSADLATRPVTALVIENSYDARPQSGLIDAGIVFEALAEGGISRFLALYQESQPQSIGPIRSLRPYFIDFGMAFDASIGHAGGSPTAISDVGALGTKDLNAFHHGEAFWRTDDRWAPHNLYTGFTALDALNTALGYTSSNFTPLMRKNDVPQTPTAAVIDFSLSSAGYDPHFEYDATTNTYKRFQDGVAHTDAVSGTQVSPKVVVALVMSKSYMADGSHILYQTVGSGTMYVFQDGILSTGTWSKADRTSSFTFTDKNGLPMQLNTGQIWISIVEATNKINYRP